MSKRHPELSSDEDDEDYNPGEAYQNEDSAQQASGESAENSNEHESGEGAFEPHSPEYLPPASPSEDNSGDRPIQPGKRRVITSDDEGPMSPDAPASPDEDPVEEPDEESGSAPQESGPASPANGEDIGDEAAANEEIVCSQQDVFENADEGEKGGGDVGDIIAGIFGDDEEDEEFKGFKEAEERESSEDSDSDAEVRRPKVKVKFSLEKRKDVMDETSKTSDEGAAGMGLDMETNDFDRLMNKRREDQRRRRKRSRGMRSGAKIVGAANMDAEERAAIEAGVDDIVQDADEIAVQLVSKMGKAAEEDRQMGQKGELACKKLLLLQEAVDLISNVDFQPSMFDNGILAAITDWLLPLPDGSLPNIKIRSELLRVIQQFPPLNNDQLKDSGLGKAIMILCKHPKEIRANKTIAKKLINEWARGIFNLNAQPSREEREQADLDRQGDEKRRRVTSTTANEPSTSAPVAKRPGDPGWIYRARVPQLPTKDYAVRPEWKVSDAPKVARKEPVSRYEKHARNLKDRATGQKRYSAPSFIQFSIEGRKVL